MRTVFPSILFSLALLLGSRQISLADELLTFDHYTVDQKLPSLYVKGITQDHFGFIWLSTRVAVCRFDGTQYKEFPAYDEKGAPVQLLPENIIFTPDSTLICSSLSGQYFFFDFNMECFRPYSLLNRLGETQAIVPSTKGFWICRDNRVYFLNPKSGVLIDIREIVDRKYIPENIEFLDITVKSEKLVAITTDSQLFVVDLKSKTSSHFDLKNLLENQSASLLLLDSQDYLWLSGNGNGLIRFDLRSGKNLRFSKSLQGKFFIPSNLIHCALEDKQNRIWVGTEGGLLVWSNITQTSTFYRYDPGNSYGLNTNPIYNSFCDKEGNVWLGTYFGGINLWRAKKSLFKIWQSGSNKWGLSGKAVSCVKEDCSHNLWIAFEDMGLSKLDAASGNLHKYTSNLDGTGLSYNNLHDLLFVSDNELWIATYTGGINILNPKTGDLRYINTQNEDELTSDNIYSFHKENNLIFIGTSNGISVFDLKLKKMRRFKPEQTLGIQFESICRGPERIWFSSPSYVYSYDMKTDSLICFDRIPQMIQINFVKADSKGRIWVGDCYNGLCSISEKTSDIKYFNAKNNFPASWIFSLEEAKNGWLWVSSDKGLIKFNPDNNYYELYDNYSGVNFNQFNFRASAKDSNGNIYFGGINGMVSFNENDSTDLAKDRKIYFTGMRLFNRVVLPGNNSPIKKSLNLTEEIKLRFDQNVFTIEFAAQSFSSNIQCKYAYYLENFEKGWNYVGIRDFATYTNLNPGTYYFHVKGSENNVEGETQERVIRIVVKPPYYLTAWAFLAYFLLICCIAILIYKIGKRIEKSKALAKFERLEKEHTEEITRLKLDFFTNISHELKTPLTLILGPLGKVLSDKKISPGARKKLTVINTNAQRLLQLVNQLLDFRKAESGKENLHVSEHDLHSLACEFNEAFETTAEAKNIRFNIHVSTDRNTVWLDSDKVKKIVFNLLSNAFKFTAAEGQIDLSFSLTSVKHDTPHDQILQIAVSDSGKGIAKEMQDKVFEKFFQIQDSDNLKGSGLGLAYAKTLVLLHKGNMSVESEVGKGTTFTISLPVSRNDYDATEIFQDKQTDESAQIWPEKTLDKPMAAKRLEEVSRKPVILVVEDNPSMLDFIKETLDNKYNVLTANNGDEAFGKLKDISPELIVSDVMMPGIDGLEFTRKLKSEIATSHVPVILLTAKGGFENNLEGLKSGADMYIEKPFFPEILEHNIENILKTRKSIIEKFRNEVSLPIREIAHSESDVKFIEHLTSLILSNIGNSDLDVTFLVNQMGISRSLLHLKLKALLNYSATEFIRSVRLKEAVKLIMSGKCNISEAAYETGFSNPAYFSNRFKEYYGKSPREYFNL